MRSEAVFMRLHWLLYLWAALLPVQLSTERTLGFRLALSDVVLVPLVSLALVRWLLERRTTAAVSLRFRTNLDGYLICLVGALAMGLLVAWLHVGQLSSYVLLNKVAGLMVMLASFYVAVALGRGRAGRVLSALLVSGSLLNFVGLLYYARWAYVGVQSPFLFGHGGRLSGLLIDPNAWGGLATVLLMLQAGALACGMRRRRWARLAGTVNALLLGVAVLLTRSRGAWVAFAGGGTMLLWLLRREISLKRVLLGATCLLLGVVALWGLLGPQASRALADVLRPRTVEVRWEQIGRGVEHFVRSPVWGIGLDVSRHLGSRWIIHNTYVWFLAEMGLIGFGALALLLLRAGRNWRGGLRSSGPLRAWAVGGTAAWVSMLFLALGIEALYQRHLWLLLALSVLLLEQATEESSGPRAGAVRHRVLIVTTVAGTVRGFLLPHIDRLRERGFDVVVACNARSEQKVGLLSARGIEVYHLPLRRRLAALGNLQGFWGLVRLIRADNYRVVEVHTPVAAFLGRLAARVADPKACTIYFAHGFHFHGGQSLLRNLPYVLLEKLAGRWTDYLVVINHEDEEAAKRYRLVPEDRLRYVPGVGVDLETFDPQSIKGDEVARVRRELGLASEEPLFVMAAEFNPGKRHRDAVHALASLERPDVHLALAGVGPLVEAIRDLACRLGVSAQVHIVGFRRDLPALMRASMATILPSQREGLSRTVMESLSLEVPVVGGDVRGIRDLVGEDAGLLVPVGDVQGLARAMAWLLQHPEEAKEMGVRGRVKMESFSLPRVLKLVDDVYAEALG